MPVSRAQRERRLSEQLGATAKVSAYTSPRAHGIRYKVGCRTCNTSPKRYLWWSTKGPYLVVIEAWAQHNAERHKDLSRHDTTVNEH